MVHECLTGHPPFRRDDDMALLWAHQYDEPPPPTEDRPDLAVGLDAVFARTLAKSPDDRYDSCLAFVAALRAAGTEDPGTGASDGGHPLTEVDLAARPPAGSGLKSPPGWAEPVLRPRGAGRAAAARSPSAPPGIP
ncbi:hypothetical protein ACL02U_25630 [Streptomyces sp. MS06]|uniref:hypothetical protein n=1 Tax=Streptomyces sp. MS06 TaxID=3385974 RepID=UPI0039A05561